MEAVLKAILNQVNGPYYKQKYYMLSGPCKTMLILERPEVPVLFLMLQFLPSVQPLSSVLQLPSPYLPHQNCNVIQLKLLISHNVALVYII